MSDARDKEMVRRAVDEELSFLSGDDDLAEKIVTGQIREKRNIRRVALCAALCAAAALLLCVAGLGRRTAEDVVNKNGAALSASQSSEAESAEEEARDEFTPVECRTYCPVCERDTVWTECCLADGYTKDSCQQTPTEYHEVNGQTCGYYEIYGNKCRFCNDCGNVFVLNTRHLHAVVHENCGEGTGCPIVEYWEAHKDENPGYLKALEKYPPDFQREPVRDDPFAGRP